MNGKPIRVRALWDAEAAVFVATSDDVPGLVAEAATPVELLSKLEMLIPELLELNGNGWDGGGGGRRGGS
jgi:hypothetical protein